MESLDDNEMHESGEIEESKKQDNKSFMIAPNYFKDQGGLHP